jgi:hypothetical protein
MDSFVEAQNGVKAKELRWVRHSVQTAAKPRSSLLIRAYGYELSGLKTYRGPKRKEQFGVCSIPGLEVALIDPASADNVTDSLAGRLCMSAKLAPLDLPTFPTNVGYEGKSGRDLDIVKPALMTHKRHRRTVHACSRTSGRSTLRNTVMPYL